MRISVVIPAYNEEKNIAACLKSLMKQDIAADEIIVVDNNSTDRTAEIARSLGARVVEASQKGIAQARNAGFDAATSDIIARTDADSCVPRDWISKIHDHFAFGTCDALSGPGIYFDLPFPTTWLMRCYFFVAKILQGGRETMLGFNMAITNDCWKKIRLDVCLDDTRIHEDMDLALQIHAAGGTVIRDNALIVATSGRRMLLRPFSFFIEYPLRFWHTLRMHRIARLKH